MKSRELPGRASQGIVGTPLTCDLETAAMRTVQREARRQKRARALNRRAEQRQAAVLKRVEHRQRAAEYARDRRARGETSPVSKRERRKIATAERVAAKAAA